MRLRPPSTQETVVDGAGRPNAVFAAFLLGLAVANDVRQREFAALVAKLKADGTIPADWAP